MADGRAKDQIVVPSVEFMARRSPLDAPKKRTPEASKTGEEV